ncbi:TMEM175 family protein [Spongiimicrobium salis]|uniref:TMEM175 family protein n=1 Tax=Spongiimicrobium salis TaxID=1667022 RepID=UPI00374D6793
MQRPTRPNHMLPTFVYDKNRIAAFCDAVFSIAMTLLILEIEVPSSETLNTMEFSSILSNRIPSFIGFLVSFLVIALYWMSHLRIYKFVTTMSERLVWLNIFLLLFVVFIPFSTAIYVGDFYGTAPFVFYCLNLVFLGSFNYLIIRAIVQKEMGNNGLDKITGALLKFRALNAVFVWGFAAVLAPFAPNMARMAFILIFIFQFFGNRYFKKKIKTAQL